MLLFSSRRPKQAMLPLFTALGLSLISGLSAYAAGPDFQLVPNPATDANLNSVVQLQNAAQTIGSGSVIDTHTINGIGYFCILTADHNFQGGNTTQVSFGNGDPGPNPFTIVGVARTVGANATNTPDLAVALVRYGTPDATFAGLVKLTMVAQGAGLAAGAGISQIGYGDTGTYAPGAANFTNLNGTNNGAGTKRYENNKVTTLTAGFNGTFGGNTVYIYDALTMTFDAFNGANVVAGEGGAFSGDSGGPLFSSSTTFDPDGAGPLPAMRNNLIGGVLSTGFPNYNSAGANNNFDAVDVGSYRTAINTACNALAIAGPAPEPGTMALALVGLVSGGLIVRRRRA